MDNKLWRMSDIELVDENVEVAVYIWDDTIKTTYVYDKAEVASGLVPFISINDSCTERIRLSDEVAMVNSELAQVIDSCKDFISVVNDDEGEEDLSVGGYIVRNEKYRQLLRKAVLDEAKRELLKYRYNSTERQMFMF